MKQFKFSILRWVFFVAYIVVIIIYLKTVVQPELIFHLQEPAFITKGIFFNDFCIYPGGLAQYAANFLLQFFYYSWTGSIVILGAGLLLLLSGFYILRSFKPSSINYLLMFIPFILLIALMNDYEFSFVVVIEILIVFLSTWLFNFILGKKIYYIVLFLLLCPTIYYLAGSGSLILFSFTAVVSFFYYKESIKKSIIFLVFAFLYCILIDIIGFKYLFSIHPEKEYFALIPKDHFLSLKTNSKLLYYTFSFYLPVIVLLITLKLKVYDKLINFKFNVFDKWPVSNTLLKDIIILFLICCFSFGLIMYTFNPHKRNIILSDYYCYNGKWKEVIELASSDPEYDVFINFNYNRAIDRSGHFLDLYYNYPQYLGKDALFPDRINAPQLSNVCSDYYYDLGFISEAQHWAFEALIINPYNIRSLERVVITNLIFGNYNGARKYLNVLDNNILAKDFVNKYEPYVDDTTMVTKDKDIWEKRSLMPDTTICSENQLDRFVVLLKKNSNNQTVFEHRQMFFLMDNRLPQFISNLVPSLKFYSHMPEVYEQAILMYILTTKQQQQIDQLKVSLKSRKGFMECLRILKECGNNREIAKPLLKDYRNTYLYYLLYNSPFVRKSELKKRREPYYQ